MATDNSLTSSTGSTDNSASNWGRNTAMVNKNQANAATDYSFSWADAKKNWERARSKLAGGFQARGMMRSGMYNRGQSEFSVDRGANFGQLARTYQGQREGFGVNRQQLDQGYFGGQMTSEMERSMRNADIAAALQDRVV